MKDLRDSFVEWLAERTSEMNAIEQASADKTVQINSLQQENQDKLAQISTLQQQIQLASDTIKSQSDIIAAVPPKERKQRIGMNCGLFNSPAYSDVDRVIDRLGVLNIKHIRVAFDYDPATGKMLSHDRWVNVCKPKLDAAGIHVRATVYLRGSDGFDAFNKFCLNYPYFNEIEIGNENSIRSIKSGSGTKETDYDLVKLQKDIDYIVGAYRALLQYPVLPVISINWIHYYYNDRLRAALVNAMLSVHSYTDGFENVGNQSGFKGLNAITAAQMKYGNMVKEVGETNYLPADVSVYTEQMQVDRFIPLFKKILDSGLDVYIYQLFDTPNRGGREAVLGMFRADGTPKPIVDELKKLLYI